MTRTDNKSIPMGESMICDFHTHTFFSDGLNSPIELIRYAYANGYSYIGIADHIGASNIDFIIESVKKDCELAQRYWDITAVPGIEITNVPAESIDQLASYAKESGVRLVVVHGESPVEKVEKGTNKAAANSKFVDIIAHPGFITAKEAEAAKKNDVFLELTYRNGHNMTNGHVAAVAKQTGARLLINSDSHSHKDLFFSKEQYRVAKGAGLEDKEVSEILDSNFSIFIKKITD